MTIITAKMFGAVGLLTGAGGATLAAVDSSTHTALIGVVSLAITSITGIAMAWIGYKQNVLNKKTDVIAGKQDALAEVVADVKKQTDGITSKLVDVTDRASRAEGELKGKADSQARQDAIDVGAASKAAAPSVPTGTRTAELTVLKKTEQNTAATAESAAATAENTAKTDAAVQELKKE